MRAAILAAFLIVAAAGAAAAAGETVRLVDCYDGDTCAADREVLPGRRNVRIANIDAPERGWRAGCVAELLLAERARAYIAQFAGATVTLSNVRRDWFDSRVVARVTLADGRDLGEAMVAAGLAVPWTGRRAEWCRP